jgi:metallophosphoesterase superfamily enzyme
MRRNIWITSDTHFFHDKIIEYCGRPENHTELIVERLRKSVKPSDVLIHAGDVIFGQPDRLKEILSSIHGLKYLVRGNHDTLTALKYLKCGFDGVFDGLVLGNAFITHKPCVPPAGMINVHGHLHNLGYANRNANKIFGETYEAYYNGNHRLYAPELFDYYPILLEKLVGKKFDSSRLADLRDGRELKEL